MVSQATNATKKQVCAPISDRSRPPSSFFFRGGLCCFADLFSHSTALFRVCFVSLPQFAARRRTRCRGLRTYDDTLLSDDARLAEEAGRVDQLASRPRHEVGHLLARLQVDPEVPAQGRLQAGHHLEQLPAAAQV